MPAENNPYLFILLLLAGAVVFALTPLVLAWLWARKFSPRNPARTECDLRMWPRVEGRCLVQFNPSITSMRLSF